MELKEESDVFNDYTKEKNVEHSVEKENNIQMDLELKDNIETQCEDSEERLRLRQSILDLISDNDKVFFRCLAEGEGSLQKEAKFKIAQDILDDSYLVFLVRYGAHLSKEHLSYFKNRPEKDGMVVDALLNILYDNLEQPKINKPLCEAPCSEDIEKMEIAVETDVDKSTVTLRKQMLDHLSLSRKAHFRSQQVGEPDLGPQEKREIAEVLLNRSASQFLARFGTHLLEEHLVYFDKLTSDDSYEVQYYLKKLRRNHCQPVTKVGIKNRRFEAMKKMLRDGDYFSETEMRNRNPLLYEQLVGQFLTPEERKERLNNIDTTNITLLNLLLEQVDRDAVKKLREEQEEEEDNALEEEENDDEEEEKQDEEMEEDDSEDDNHLEKTLWGEGYTDGESSAPKKLLQKKEERKPQVRKVKDEEVVQELSDAERRLLMDEFRTNMFSSFLEGKDGNYDYSQVDYNSDYDDLEAQDQDEEEKYFDNESSQDAISCGKMSSDGEDMLDQFMTRLKPEPTPQQLADKIQTLTHSES